MAATLGKDARKEIEQMMQAQLRTLFSQLENSLNTMVVEGNLTEVKASAATGYNSKAGGARRFSSKEPPPLQDAMPAKDASPSTSSCWPASGGYQSLEQEEEEEEVMEAPPAAKLTARGSGSARDIAPSPEEHQDMAAIAARKVRMNMLVLVLVLINACADAWAIDTEATLGTDEFPSWYKWLQLCLCAGFAVELYQRIKFKGLSFFYHNVHWHWFQVTLVTFQVLQMIVIVSPWWFGVTLPYTESLRKWLRLFSVLRVLRVFNVLDHLECATELHLLLTSMHGSLHSLAWAALFMLVPMFVFAMALTQEVADFRMSSNHTEEELKDLVFYFGSIDRSMLALFMSISGGLSWSDAMFPLRDWHFKCLEIIFVLYVAAMVFAVLNVLTGVFVNSASSAASEEKEKTILATLKGIFADVDQDGSGTLSSKEFETLVQHKDLGICLQSLDIPPSQASHLFALFDADGSGNIEVEEFLAGCNHMQGSLKAIDFASYMAEFHTLQADLGECRHLLEQIRSPTTNPPASGSNQSTRASGSNQSTRAAGPKPGYTNNTRPAGSSIALQRQASFQEMSFPPTMVPSSYQHSGRGVVHVQLPMVQRGAEHNRSYFQT